MAHAIKGVWHHRNDAAWEAGRTGLIISLGIGAAWLPVALVSPIWATVMIWVMLLSVLASLHKTQSATPNWAANWPVALYAGWLTAASSVSVGLLGAGYGLVFAEFGWAIISLIIAGVIALYVLQRIAHWTYGAGVAWGLIGIIAQNAGSNTTIATLAGVAALLVVAQTVLQNRMR